jgi:hypothetical protein
VPKARHQQQTFYRWKAKYGGLEVSEAQRLRQLEEENRKLKQLVAEQALDIVGFKAALGRPTGRAGGREGVSGSDAVLRTATCGRMEILRAMVRYQARGTR